MSNQLEKLKKSINKEYTKNFELNLMKSSGFIPVDKRKSEIFVILNKNNLSNKLKIEEIIKNKYSELTPKFIPVESSDFETLLSIVNEPVASEKPNEVEGQESKNEPTAALKINTIIIIAFFFIRAL